MLSDALSSDSSELDSHQLQIDILLYKIQVTIHAAGKYRLKRYNPLFPAGYRTGIGH